MSQQVIDAQGHELLMAGSPRPGPQPWAIARRTVVVAACRPDARLAERTFAKVSRYLNQNRSAIAEVYPSLGAAVEPGELMGIPSALWPEVLADALTAVAGGRAGEARDHLAALHLCRVRTYWQEIEALRDPDAIDALLDEQAEAVVAAVSRRHPRFTVPRPTEFHPAFCPHEPPSR